MIPRLLHGLTFEPPNRWDTSKGLACHAGHTAHATRRVDVSMRGQGVVHEWPAISDHLAVDLTFDVYEWQQYSGFKGYCSGQDEFSHALAIGQVWEGYETLLALAILAEGRRSDIVLDFGAHLGWYTCLAGKVGYDVVAFEADPENAARCAVNAALNGCGDLVHVVPTWIGEDSPALPADAEHVRLLKSDMEGMEHQVVRMCAGLFEARRIDFALLEMSPVFVRNARHPGWEMFGDYAGLARWICDRGYEAFEVPGKSATKATKAAFERDPLFGVLDCRVAPGDLDARLGAVDQANYLFVKRGLL